MEYRAHLHGVEHLAIHGDLGAEPPRLYVHIGCVIGRLLGSSDLGVPRIRLERDAPISRQYLTMRGVEVVIA